jgi:soluble lytic murein transglycosylase
MGFSACGTHVPVLGHEDYSEDMRLRRPDATKVAKGEGVHLSEALNKNLGEELTDPNRRALLHFIESAKRTKRSSKSSECERKFKNAPECLFLKPGKLDSFFEDEEEVDESESEIALKASQRNSKVKITKSFKKKHSKVITAIYQNLLKGQSEKIKDQVEGDYYRALKRVDSWKPELDQLAESLVGKACSDPELYVYLGLKAEEFFPDEQKLSRVLSLYRKADECNLDNATNKYVQLARFRMGLLSIVKNDCEGAQKVFNRLSKMGVNDYSTRAHYWSAYCARSESKKVEFLASFDELFKTNPLGFHTLSINNGDSVLVENLSTPIDPRVKQRTSLEGQYNLWIRMLEDYDRMKSTGMVTWLLSPVRKNPEYLLRLEPGVRLYLSTFAYRTKDMISLFRMLDSVFRTQSEYVVDSTLKLFYPLKYLDRITEESKKVNPLLIAALIRQESAFQEGVKSKVGAMGLMQLMPGTARLMDRKVRKKDLIKPEVNIRLGVRYFQLLVDRFNGDVELALASYNAGSEVVDRWQKRYPTQNRLLFLDLMPYAETRNYVTLIGRNYYWYSKIYGDQISVTGANRPGGTEFRGLKVK